MNAGPTEIPRMAHGLAGYVHAVATAVGAPDIATSCELADTTTAYIALSRACAHHPDRDLMLVWSAGTGWVLAVETELDEASLVLGYYGPTLVPTPEQVAQFVATLASGTTPNHPEPPNLTTIGVDTLEQRLAPYLNHGPVAGPEGAPP